MVWFEILPSLVLTAGPLLLVAVPTLYVGNWYFLNGKVTPLIFDSYFHVLRLSCPLQTRGPRNLLKDDRDYYLFLRDRRITGNEYYPRVCLWVFLPTFNMGWFLSCRVWKPSKNVPPWSNCATSGTCRRLNILFFAPSPRVLLPLRSSSFRDPPNK